ncbi:MAG: cell division protein ZapA [Bacteroidetes bacterium]|nr:cell division protein ZapA [Bacteroidota bacterium]
MIPIRVPVADRLLPLKVARKDEEYVRLAARMLNRRMEEFKTYNSGETIDRLAWAALDFTGDLVRYLRSGQNQTEAVEDELKRLEELLQGR